MGGSPRMIEKFRSNLTLNVGLRYEYYSPVSEPQGLLSNLVLAGSGPDAIANATLVTGKTVYSTPKTNFTPRFGFAWSPDMYNQKVVVRGGFGMSSPIRFRKRCSTQPVKILRFTRSRIPAAALPVPVSAARSIRMPLVTSPDCVFPGKFRLHH